METNPKFAESIGLGGWSVFDGEKMAPAKALHRTVPYGVWEVKTETHLLECADFHFLFYEDGCRVLACELQKGDRILVDGGAEAVVSVKNTGRTEEMYDAEMDTSDHKWSTNGIVSHNTTTCTAFLLHYALFNPEKKIAILANKGAQAREIMQRIELAYLHLPKWLQCGIKTWNKGSMELANGSSIISATTSSDSIRGQSYSCVSGNTIVVVADDEDNVWFKPIETLHSSKYTQNKDCSMQCYDKLYFYVYKIVNQVNNKEYIGFHSTNDLNDGYMGSGKLILRALEKYGPSAFKKTILKIFDNQKDAEDYERYLVDEEYVKREDTYNLSLGGNVCILSGKNNGFYGKKHTPETRAKITERETEYWRTYGKPNNPDDDVIVDGVRYNSFNDARLKLGISVYKLNQILRKDGNGYVNVRRQRWFLEKMIEEDRKRELGKLRHAIKHRYITFSDDRNRLISESKRGEKHPWQDKVNKNPDKIRKTAEKHRGMKRSEEARRHMSEAQKRRFARERSEKLRNAESIDS